MNSYYKTLLIACDLSIFIATAVAVGRYRFFNIPFKIIAALLLVTMASETGSYIAVINNMLSVRYAIYHFYNIVQACLISCYFIYAIKPLHHKGLLIASIVFWLLFGTVNILYWQPLRELNTNMLLMESFAFITASLYFIYLILKKDIATNIFSYPHFWMSVIWLVMWSCSISFWAFVKILYRGNWPYMSLAISVQAIIEILSYLGMSLVLFFYNKQTEVGHEH